MKTTAIILAIAFILPLCLLPASAYTTEDALTVLRAAVGLNLLTAEQREKYNLHGEISTTDALFVLQVATGIIQPPKPEPEPPREPLPTFISSVDDTITLDPSEYYEALTRDDIQRLSNWEAQFINRPGGANASQIIGTFTTGLIFTPEDAVKALTSVRDILNIGDFSYHVTINRHPLYDTNRFNLQQVYNGVEVFGGSFTIHTNLNGEPIFVLWADGYRNVGGVDTTPVISVDFASKAVTLRDNEEIAETKLVIYRSRLCWHFRIVDKTDSLRDFFGRDVFVNAHTGDLVG